MLAKSLISKVDVLKVSHHGAKETTTTAFLNKAKPTYAVISVRKNGYVHHPTSSTIKRLNSVKAKIYRTDKQGNIIFLLQVLNKL